MNSQQRIVAAGTTWFGSIFSRENLAAVLLCLAILAIIIFTADQAPQWIYQGF
jgi:hypothetical protein